MLTISGYQIQEQLYESAHSIIYRGRRKADDQPVVLKLLKNEYPTPEELARFRREYEMTRGIDIDGVVNVYGLESYRNTLVMVLEDFGGESLTKLLPDKTLKLSEFLRLAIRIADILGAIHHRNIMHKDINPSNIVWNLDTTQLKIIDFGISTELSREQPEIRNPNVLEGTLAYMSPEQTGRMNRAMDYRADLYSLGATFYHLLTGQLPFQAEDAMELVHCHLAKMPVPPSGVSNFNLTAKFPISPDSQNKFCTPKTLSDIIMKLLAKNAEDRYQNAFGLKTDLQTCLDQLTATSTIEPFAIAQQDISERFQIPQKLYGREQEIDILLTAFDRVSSHSPLEGGQGGVTELLLVTGYAGIGKSALVHEVHKPITEKRGYFISGKFDQFKRNIPYSALIQAFQGLMRQLLTEPEEQLALWKEKFLKAVGPNGQVIIDVIPDVELIIGQQPDVPELPPNQAQNRFNFVFQNFVRTCASAEHPLVIFLDDLQWADWASLSLLQIFMTDARTQFMLIVGTYRDNEVSDAHPLMLTLNDIQKAGATVNTITLTPLALEHVNQLIVDTLHSQTEVCTPFGELLLQKTGGNPFFIRQFLQALYEDELLEFDAKRGAWAWELEEIRKREMTDNVVELMAGKIQKLSEATQDVLKLAACIGNQFDLHTLSVVYEHSPTDTLHDLWKALQEELILPLDDSYKYVASDIGNMALRGGEFKFLHDRVQQAAYSLIEERHKQEIHLKIGQLLLSNTREAEREEHIFDIVNHLNLGKDLTAQSEKDELAQLNLTAGRKAKSSAAYQAAFMYFQSGIALLGTGAWQQQYEMALALHEEAAEAAYLSGDFEKMEQLVEVVIENASTLLDKVKAHEVKIQAYVLQHKTLEALQTALPVLKLLGVTFPEKPTKFHIVLGLLTTKFALTGKQIESLSNLPKMTDPYKLATMRIISFASVAAFRTTPELMPLMAFKQIKFLLKYGNISESAFVYTMYGFMLCGFVGDIETGYQFGKLALSILEQFQAKEYKARTLLLMNITIKHWKDHARSTLQALLQAYQTGWETGDFEYAGYSVEHYIHFSLFTGSELTEFERECAKFSDVIRQLRGETPLHYIEISWQTALNLMGETSGSSGSLPWQFVGSVYNEEEMLAPHYQADDKVGLFYFYIEKTILCYLFQAYSQAVENVAIAEMNLDGGISMFVTPLFHFYDSLSRLAIFPDAPKSEQRRILKKVAANQKKMKKWAQHAPMNHLHKWYLVEAERARVLGKDVDAMEYYDKAIEGAKEHEYLNEEALANELAAKFYLERGRTQIARTYMREARYCYLKWGAKAKVRHLDETYPELLAERRDGRHLEGGAHLTLTKTPSIGTRSSELDLATLMKASQTISGEIVLADLLKKMMGIVIENAGAQKGFLMLEKSGKWYIEAEGTVDDKDVKVLQSVPIESNIPVSIVQYVARTQESVVLHDATQEGDFTRDPYITTHQPKSLLCLPLLNQGRLTGMLYLENNLTTGAFTPDRVEVLNLFSSQAAISIENAQLYTNLTAFNKAYERFVPSQFLSFLEKGSIVDVHLGDQVEKEMTILFSDIRDFTTHSETMTPQENFNFINSYLSRMEPVIIEHHGFIDKYIGDAIMALFAGSADDAVQTGITMLHRLTEYNQERHKAGYQPIRIGVGINTGSLMLGTIGSQHRMDGTVISNAVNVASRIEGLTKIYGASIVISEQTLSRLKDQTIYNTRFLGKVQVKGKKEAVSVFEIYDGDPEKMIELKLKTKSDFEEGLHLYYAKEFAEAAVCFKQVLKTNPDDKTADLYLKRSAQFMVQGVPDDWDGVETLEHK